MKAASPPPDTRCQSRGLAAWRVALPLCGLLALLLLPACRRFTKAGADREVYGILEGKRTGVPELAGSLDIEAKTKLADAIRKREAFELDLHDTLELATTASREYRQQTEDVFLSALALTREMNQFRGLWGAGGTPRLNFTDEGVIIDGSAGLSMSQALANGGTVVFGLASEFTRLFAGDPLRVAQSILDADVVLPLMRGSGNLVAQEDLRQAERNTCYALRDYAQFQQTFTVDIASRFYRALQQRDRWDNAEKRYKSFELLQEELSAKAVSGRIPRFEVDQSEQRLLESDDARQRARNDFETSIDRLKLDLGIPVGVQVILKDTDLAALRERGPQPVALDEAKALDVATDTRLDLRTSRDEEVDARRKALVAKDGLRMDLDIVLGGNIGTTRQNALDWDGRNAEGRLGLDFDLPLERTAERNVYRRALINVDRAQRTRERLEDTVTFEVRDSYRTLAQARRSYDIQVVSQKLAERRVESTQLLLEQGKASTRDRLDAEDDLALARNAVTGAIIDHFLARLALLRDIGKLRVDAEGSWQEPKPKASPGALDPSVTLPGSPGATNATPRSGVASQGTKRAPIHAAPISTAPSSAARGEQLSDPAAPAGTGLPPPAPARAARRNPIIVPSLPPEGRVEKAPRQSQPGLPPPQVVPRSSDKVDA